MNPFDFPVGSVRSRAAARKLLRSRVQQQWSNASEVIMTGLAVAKGRLSVEAPDSVAYRLAGDGSVVELVLRYWNADRVDGLTIFLTQLTEDGGVYRGSCPIGSFAEALELPVCQPGWTQ
jgi:hypothetical protein